MLFGSEPFAVVPYAVTVGPSQAVRDPFVDLLNDQNRCRVYLLDAEPWYIASSSVRNLRASNGVAGTPNFGGYLWPKRLEGFDIELGIDAGDDFLEDPQTAFGNLNLAIADGWEAAANNPTGINLCDLQWDGRDVRILMGAEDMDFADFGEIFKGTARAAVWNEDHLTIQLRDFSEKLDELVQDELYLGTGGLEGPADLLDRPKPKVYGTVTNIEPVLIDFVTGSIYVYQVNDGPTQSIAVFSDGAALTPATPPDVADVYAWTPIAGQFVTDLAHGVFRLGSNPSTNQNIITADVEGDNSGSGYVSDAFDVIERIVTTEGIPLVGADIDSGALAAAKAAAPYTVGLYVTEPVKINELIDAILSSVGGYRTWSATGVLKFGVIAFGSPTATIDNISGNKDIVSMEHVDTEPPVYKRTLKYKRSYVVQETTAEDADDARKLLVSVDYRLAVYEDIAVKFHHPLAIDLESESVLQIGADASAIATAQVLTLFGGSATGGNTRERYNLRLRRHQFLHEQGETITVVYDRFGLSAGRDFIVIGKREDISTGETELRLWG